ncbi:MAG: hypothetical protein PW845_00720 [Pseudomonas sp.]|nr:hypothetical protein [Pseudomonas sp.]
MNLALSKTIAKLRRNHLAGNAQINQLEDLDGEVVALLALPDGKLMLGINLDGSFCIARLTADLQLDTSFQEVGYFEDDFNDHAFGFAAVTHLALRGETLLVTAAQFDFFDWIDRPALASYTLEGEPDLSFGDHGKVVVELPDSTGKNRKRLRSSLTPVGSPQTLDDGKILLFFLEVRDTNPDGSALLIRLNANGSLDDSLNGSGVVHVTFNERGVNPKGVLTQGQKLLVFGGTQPVDSTGYALIARYDASGHLDTSFNDSGFVAVGIEGQVARFNSLLIDEDDTLVAVGNQGAQVLMAKRLPEGATDPDFNGGTALAFALPELDGEGFDVDQLYAMRAHNRSLVVAGTGSLRSGPFQRKGVLLRLLPNGQLDGTFAGGHGYRIADIRSEYYDLLIEPQAIVTAGYYVDDAYHAWVQRFGIDG